MCHSFCVQPFSSFYQLNAIVLDYFFFNLSLTIHSQMLIEVLTKDKYNNVSSIWKKKIVYRSFDVNYVVFPLLLCLTDFDYLYLTDLKESKNITTTTTIARTAIYSGASIYSLFISRIKKLRHKTWSKQKQVSQDQFRNRHTGKHTHIHTPHELRCQRNMV